MGPDPDMMLESRSLPPRPGNLLPTLACSISGPAQLLQTPCGTAIRSLENLVAAEHFKLPTVIITGGRGHGKIYTLENLVKKRIFPQSGQRGITALGDLDSSVLSSSGSALRGSPAGRASPGV